MDAWSRAKMTRSANPLSGRSVNIRLARSGKTGWRTFDPITRPDAGTSTHSAPRAAIGIGHDCGGFVTILGIVLARAGSEGLKNKHLLPLLGRPVISYTFEAARRARRLNRIVVTTDSAQIRQL